MALSYAYHLDTSSLRACRKRLAQAQPGMRLGLAPWPPRLAASLRDAEANQAFHAGRQDRLSTSVAIGDEAYKLWKQTDAMENAVVGQFRPSQW